MALDRLEAIMLAVSLRVEPESEEEGTVDGGMTV
jgi:hypothetical protein